MRTGLATAFLALLSLPALAQTPQLEQGPDGSSRLTVTAGGQTQLLRTTSNQVDELRALGADDHTQRYLRWRELDPAGVITEWYAASPDGEAWPLVRPLSFELTLRYASHDPLQGEPDVPAELSARPDSALRLVQLDVPPAPELQESVVALDADIHRIVHRHALLISASDLAAERIAGLEFVRAVRPYHPAYKIDPELIPTALGIVDEPSVAVNLLTVRRGEVDQREVLSLAASLGGQLISRSPETYLVSLSLPGSAIARLAASDSVAWIDRWSEPEDDMDIARQFHGADYVESALGLSGASLRVEVLDGGCDLNHPDLANHVVHGSMVSGSHGTATSGIVCGSGAGNPSARGVLPDSLLIAAYYSGLSGSRYNHTSELDDPNGSYRAILQTNSWGNARTTSYTSISQDMDVILFDFEKFSILQSQSNAGNQDSRPQAWAKNIISVGGIRHYNTLGDGDDSWSSGASIGPAADGRIKPDLASFYDYTETTDVLGSGGYSSGDYTTTFGGTSGATPIVAGHLGMLLEMWGDGVFGNSAPAVDPFDDRPHNTTAKALLINTATQWSFSGTNADLTRTHQGWGRPDLQVAYDLKDKTFVVDETDVLAPLASTTHTINVTAGEPALKATMIYRDIAGTTSSSLHRINDLDLKVTSPSGTIYWGNNGLLGSMWSSAGGSPDGVDTVENVFVANPESGAWSIEVIAVEVLQDTHVETGAIDADYALVVTGGTAGPPAPPVAEFSATPLSGYAPLEVNFTNQTSGSVDAQTWTFGDGGTSNVSSPVYTYTAPGTYTVNLAVSGPGGVDDISKVDYVTVDVLPPPDAPSDLATGGETSDSIDLNWIDNSSVETSFEVERSLDGASWSGVASVGANVTSMTDSGLDPGTTYFYRVFASNSAGDSGYSNQASGTTTTGETEIVVALADILVQGSVTGSYVSTQTADGSYQSLRERESGGKPANRTSLGEHMWSTSLPAGTGLSFHLKGYRTLPTDGDDWSFECSTDQSNWSPMLTLTKTADDGQYQNITLPASLVGTVYVRVIDTNRNPGNRDRDTVYVDHMYFQVTGVGGGLPPGAPSNLVATASSSSQIDLSWSDGSSNEDGFELQRSPDGVAWATIDGAVPANSTAASDSGLTAETSYSYRIRAWNSDGESDWSNISTATTFSEGTVDVVPYGEQSGSGTVTGTFADVQSEDGAVQSLQERQSGGKPANRYSYGSHTWLLNAPSGSVTLFVKGSMIDAGDGESFAFEVSTNGGATWFTTSLEIDPSTSGSTYQQAFIAGSFAGGTVQVRVTDTDQTSGFRNLETVLVDHLFLRIQ